MPFQFVQLAKFHAKKQGWSLGRSRHTVDLDTRLSFKILPLLILGMHVKSLAHLRHLARQAETYSTHPPHATEQYLNKF